MAMKYEIARPSLRNIDLSSNLILVGVQILTLAQGLGTSASHDISAVRERLAGGTLDTGFGLSGLFRSQEKKQRHRWISAPIQNLDNGVLRAGLS